MLAVDLPTPPAAVAPEEPRSDSARPVEVGTVFRWDEILRSMEVPPERPLTKGEARVWREKLWRRQKQCFYCQKFIRPGNSTLDHVIPVSHGGGLLPSNLKLCCEACNQLKDDSTPAEFLNRLESIAARLRLLVDLRDGSEGVA